MTNSSNFKAIWNNKQYRIAIICGICLLAVILIWAFVSFVGDKDQTSSDANITETNKAQVTEEKLTPREKIKRKIPLTPAEQKQLADELRGDFSKINTKPVEDKGY